MANQVGSMNNSGKLMSSNIIFLQLVAVVKDRPDLDPFVIYTNQLFNSEISNRPVRHWHVNESTGMRNLQSKT